MVKVIAKKYIVDGDKSYRPGDEITEGQIYEQRQYYEALGQLEIRDGMPFRESTTSNSEDADDDAATDFPELDGMKYDELKTFAESLGLSVPSNIRKADLIKRILEARGALRNAGTDEGVHRDQLDGD